MQYHGYLIIQELCEGVLYILEDFHKYYIVNGQLCVLKYSTINTLNVFASWVITRTNQKRFDLPSQYFLSLTYQEFNKFREENMSRTTKVPTTQTPSKTKPLLGHNTKSKPDYIPHLIDLFDESICESAEKNLVQLEKLKSPTSFSPYSTNLTGFYPSPKSFWSCTHVNSCQKYALYINLHILLNILCKTSSNIQESRKSIKRLKR